MPGLPPLQRVSLTTAQEGTIICPQCQYSKRGTFAQYFGVRDLLKVKCRCGCIFPIVFEGRKYYRKPTHLPGRYTHLITQEAGPLLIRNLSFTGVGFVTTLSHHLQVGDTIELSFILDDPRHSAICRRARIQHVFTRAVGAAFCHLYAYEKELGFYLFQHETLGASDDQPPPDIHGKSSPPRA